MLFLLPFYITLEGRSLEDFSRHADGDECRRLQRGGEEVARHRKGPALETALHRTHLPADDRVAEIPARHWLQDLYRYRWRSGVYSEEVYAFHPSKWSAL